MLAPLPPLTPHLHVCIAAFHAAASLHMVKMGRVALPMFAAGSKAYVGSQPSPVCAKPAYSPASTLT